MKAKYLLIVGVALSLSGCASMVNKVDADSVASVKTVAIVGLTYDQENAHLGTAILDTMMGKNESMGGLGKSVGEIEAKAHTAQALKTSEAALKARKGWKVLDTAVVAKNPVVQRMYDKKKATVQMGIAPLKPNFYRYEAKGIPQFYNLQFEDKALLNAMAKDLGVDALVLVNASTHIAQTRIMGIGVGTKGTVSDIAFFLYDPKKSDFTVVMNTSGEKIKETRNQLDGFTDGDPFNLQALEAYQSAFNKAVEAI